MKLLDKTNFYFVGVSLVIFCLGGILFYLLFQVIINNDINNKLHQRKEYTLKDMEHADSIMLFQKYSGNIVSISSGHQPRVDPEVISDTVIYDAIEGKPIQYRQLSFNATIKNRDYTIRVRRALVEQKELIEGVVLLEIILFLAFVAILTVVNNQVSKSIWKPFYFIVDKISEYKVDRGESISLPKNSIKEFNELSMAIEKMSSKISQEFSIQKEFTENASHEIQTPLAIVKNKLEILLQSPGLSNEQMELINSASVAIHRLSKLNEALIILSKIENRQFHEVEDICINDIVERQLQGLCELIQIKSIAIKRNYRSTIKTKMHPYLGEMLMENLIINSIKHNTSPGNISITTDDGRLELRNSGGPARGDTQRFFHRFVKSNPASQSLGLGLSIVKAICETYILPIHYQVETGYHKITIDFR
jgi:signal transduction histidine kinase